MVFDLISLYSKLSNFSFEKRNDDDATDRCSRKFSAIGLVIFAVVLSTYSLVGQPIKCWCPNEYSDARCAYATTFCYITSLYIPVSNGTGLPPRDKYMSHKIMYYQWVAYIFLFQAFLFYFPCIIWRWLSQKTGFELFNYITELKNNALYVQENKAINYVALHMQTCINFRSTNKHRGLIRKRIGALDSLRGITLFMSHIFVKFTYLFVTMVQIFLLNYWFRDVKYTSLHDVIFGFFHRWKLSERFPRMTLCKFNVYVYTDEQLHWLQCTLPINIYIEKAYLIIWWWLWINLAITFLGLLSKLRYLLPWYRKKYLGDLLGERVNDFLTVDAFLVIKLIKTNTNEFFSTQIAKELYKVFNRKQGIIDNDEDYDENKNA